MKKRQRKILRGIALFICINMLFQIVFPTVSYALTSGPSSPEFSSFQPVASTDMVNTFTGDFNYNLPVLEIPGPDGAGYSMSLSYQSGASVEDESSWVGFGWTLNPGAINRNMRGFPDDFNGQSVSNYNKARVNWSSTVNPTGNLKIFGTRLGISASASLRYNNYQGYWSETGFGISIKGVTLGINFSDAGTTYSASVNPMELLSGGKEKEDKQENKAPLNSEKTKSQKKSKSSFLKESGDKALESLKGAPASFLQSAISTYGFLTFGNQVRATSVANYSGFGLGFVVSAQVNPADVPVGGELGYQANFNLQKNDPQVISSAYGFMNNPNGFNSGSDELSDYYLEKSSPFTKRDYFIGLPFANYDVFSVSGEGVGGGFRFVNNQIGNFYPKRVKSGLFNFNLGLELMVGPDVGLGVNIGAGLQTAIQSNWDLSGNTGDYNFGSNSGFFRFNNDLGGIVSYSNSPDYTTAGVSLVHKLWGFRTAQSDIPSNSFYKINQSDTSNSNVSSYIKYTNFSQNSTLNKNVNLSDIFAPDNSSSLLREFEITNEEGLNYLYGLPVLVRNETNLHVDVNDQGDGYITSTNYLGLNWAYNVDVYSEEHKTIGGEVKNDAYANAYLLTQITSPDFVDRANDGPDSTDFGGWTKFQYHKAYGDTNTNHSGKWYRYRMPYTGLLYDRGTVSDKTDDIGSVVTGEKEVYYLRAVETKTHIAFFVTNLSDSKRFPEAHATSLKYLNGSKNNRLDGLSAADLTTDDPAASDLTKKGTNPLEYLEKIVLFSKSRPDQPLKTINFAYDYSLAPNVANNSNSNFPANFTTPNSGKLTLKKVWFDYEGTYNATISPYVFTYAYKDPTSFDSDINSLYSDITNYSLPYTAESQNPSYDPHSLDVWGNVQAYGNERSAYDIPWVYQGLPIQNRNGSGLPDDWRKNALITAYDPAAWQLKQIQLPSGGEILIQYEEKDYSTVQDRNVMSMVSLLGVNSPGSTTENPVASQAQYIINSSDIGVDPTDQTSMNELCAAINSYYGNNNQKIYFKFLYDMLGNNASLDNPTSEYISGYANFDHAAVTNVGGTAPTQYQITIYLQTGEGSAQPPKQGCYDFATMNRGGMKLIDGSLTGALSRAGGYEDKIQENNNKSDQNLFKDVKEFLYVIEIMGTLSSQFFAYYKLVPDKVDDFCLSINPALSFFKIPLIRAKKGGGVRVKRLLMYDQGIETGDAAIYGSEYLYIQKDGTSSGVATNEPSGAREENPLVTFLPKKDQDWFTRLTVGVDKSQTEGPIGESILPGASIGYSRVVAKNIHSGKTGTGYSVHEYYTAKDYPFDKVYNYDPLASLGRQFDISGSVKSTDFSDLGSNNQTDFMLLPAGLFSLSVNKVWTAQGFCFVQNNMHGQVKKMASYNGDYDKPFSTISTMQEFSYFEPGEKLPMLRPDGTVFYATPGKEMDVTMEMRQVENNSIDFGINIELSIAVFPLIFVYGVPSFSMSDEAISTHSTTKVTNYPSVIKKVVNFQDGVYNIVENLAFDRSTGKPLLTMTNDAYDNLNINGKVHDGSIYTFSYPAYWAYPQMGPKSASPTNSNELNTMAANIVTYGAGANPLNAANLTWKIPQTGVLEASAQTFSNNWASSWNNPLVQTQYGITSNDIVKLDSIYRPLSNYVFKNSITSANLCDTCKVYNAGFIKNFSMFDWSNVSQSKSKGWLEMNTSTLYSPNGMALEEKNILKIYSAAIYGYRGQILPTMLAKNAQYGSIGYDDFENNSTANIDAFAHSGQRSLNYVQGLNLLSNQLAVTQQLINKGGLLKFWYKSSVSPNVLTVASNNGNYNASKVATTGKWTLYQATIGFKGATIGNTIALSLTGGNSGDAIDDVRFQPTDATSTCYVYDIASLRLITQFDDQHFGLIYQYNDEGKLVRKIAETIEGTKTVQETQYNLPKESRNKLYE